MTYLIWQVLQLIATEMPNTRLQAYSKSIDLRTREQIGLIRKILQQDEFLTPDLRKKQQEAPDLFFAVS